MSMESGRDRAAGALRAALVVPLLGAALAACAPALRVAPAPGPEEIARLEATAAERPDDVGHQIELGRAYQAAGRSADARPLLERSVQREPDHPAAVLSLGLVYEDLGLFAEARQLYGRYLEVGTSRALRTRLRNRLPMLEREAARAAVREVLAQEANIGGAGGDPSHVAVFPFIFDGDDEEMLALSRALAELLATDLAQTDRITVLERVQMQALLEELKLSESGAVDPATAARGGRLLGAGRIIQGRLDAAADQLRLQAQVVSVEQAAGLRTVSDEDALQRLFDLEKRLALAIYAALGVELTPSERERVARRPTENLQALLAFGRGLLAEESGAYSEAAAYFSQAFQLDPQFGEAAERGRGAEQSAANLSVTPQDLAALAAVEEPPVQLPAIGEIEAMIPPVVGRDPAAEVLGNEGVGRALILEIILRRPQ